MKVKSFLLLMLLALCSVLLTTCDDTTDPGAGLDYAAKAREIVADMYTTPKDDMQVYNFYDHFETILAILGVQIVDDATQTASDATLTLPSECVENIRGGMLMEFMHNDYDNSSSYMATKMYYPLADIPAFLSSAGWDIEREAGYGDLTADDLKSVIDYYISLYENNTTIERQYFAGYLIGAIAKNNPDVGTYADQYALDRLQLFLFLIDAFDLPEGLSFDSIPERALPGAGRESIALQTGGSKSFWGAGANTMKVRPSNTRQKVIDILDDGYKTYAYSFKLSGSASIYCGTWDYIATAIRSCTWTETSSSPLAPLDCGGYSGVPGLSVDFDEYTQDHDYLAPLVPPKTDSSGSAQFEIFCSRQCPPGKEKSCLAGLTNANGYVTAQFTGTDTAINYPIFPARAVFKLKERVGDQCECHND